MTTFDARTIPDEVGRGTKDPEIAEWLKTGPVLGGPSPFYAQRREHDAFVDPEPPPVGRVEHLGLKGPHGTLPVRVYHPTDAHPTGAHLTGAEGPLPALVYLHGGGFVVGTLDQFETAMRRFCEGARCQVYAVDYRLAPEYKWPVQLEEGAFAVRWLFEHAAGRGVDPSRIALGGDSAGGNLTCTITLKLRDEGGPRLAVQMPLYPETTMPFETKAGVENRTGGYVDTAGVHQFLWHLLPHDVDWTQELVTPMNAKSHAGLPPALLVTCGYDMLRDVGHAYAKKLAAAGNDLTYVHYPELPHGIVQMTMHSKACLAATEEVARLLGRKLRDGQAG